MAGKRILMLIENNPYPQDPRVRREAEALRSAGYGVSVVCPSDPGQKRRELVDGVRVYRFREAPAANGVVGYLWEYGYSLLATFLLTIEVFFREGFDVIHTANPPDTMVFVAAFYKLLGKRFVYDHHDLSPEMYYARFGGQGSRLLYGALVFLEKLSCRLADHVIATNESYKTMEMQRGHVPEERITVVRNAPDWARLKPVEPDPDLTKMEKTIIGYAGVMGFQDGLDYLLRALHHMVHDLHRTDFYCVLIGGRGDAQGSLKALTTQLGLDDYVRFTGWVSDADYVRYLRTADICVDPDPSNPFNDRSTMNKIMEYMAVEKPIVAFDLPEHRFTAQEAALYVRPNDELEFARAIVRLMDDPGQRRAMGAFGRKRLVHELAWEHSVPRLLEAYNTLLSGAGRGTPADWGLRIAESAQDRPHSAIRASRPKSGRVPALPNPRPQNGQSSPAKRPPGNRKAQQFARWLDLRDTRYIALRTLALLRRYGITPTKARRRTMACVKFLAERGCYPTFATPGRVVSKHAKFCRELQAMGVEFAVHGYDHVDFRNLSGPEATRQFDRAIAAYRSSGIQFEGFRCPYLSYTDNMLPALPEGEFKYSSNKAVWWDVVPPEAMERATAIFNSLRDFYRAEEYTKVATTPALSSGLLEIPVCLPDELEIYDGLKMGESGLEDAWLGVLRQTHARGETFVLLFHPESFEHCKRPLERVLCEARHLQPAVWVTQLRDVSRWWQEKSAFAADLSVTSSGLEIRFACSERGTVLVRNLGVDVPSRKWDDKYQALDERVLNLPDGLRPFVGVSPETPSSTISFLKEQGYIVDSSEQASSCSVYLDDSTLARLDGRLQLVNYIESWHAPLVKFGRWPDGAKSAFCVTGDLDAMSLVDYAARFFIL